MDEPQAAPAEQQQQQQQPARSVSTFILMTFLLFMLTGNNGDNFVARQQYQEAVQSLTYQLNNYTAWINNTDSEFSLPEISNATTPLVDSLVHFTGPLEPWNSYYSNITGFIHGKAAFHNLTQNSTHAWNDHAQQFMAGVNSTEMNRRIGHWQWDASNKVVFRVAEKSADDPEHLLPANISDGLTLIHGAVELTSRSADIGDLHFDFEGVHFVDNGTIYGFAEPNGHHVDIRWLPALVPPEQMNDTAKFILPELHSRIKKLNDMLNAGTTEHEAVGTEESKHSCPFIFFGQIAPTLISPSLMRELESEINTPTGIWMAMQKPKMQITGTLLSRECGIMYEIKETIGIPLPVFFRKITTYASTSCLVYLCMLVLLSRQINISRTPLGISRVSAFVFTSQSLLDGVSFVTHVTFAILMEGRPSIALIAPAFLALVIFFYTCQFSFLIPQIQAPEETTPPLPPLAVQVTTSTTTSRPSSDSPALQGPPNATSPTPTPNDNPFAVRVTDAFETSVFAGISSLFVEIYRDRQSLIVFLFVVFSFTLAAVFAQVIMPYLMGACVIWTYSSMWLFQIIRSARRGRSSGFSVQYIIGTTLGRLYFMLYFLACPNNVLDIQPRPWAYQLALFVCAQAIILILQQYLGPGFFLPNKYAAVQIYNYHPTLPPRDDESPEHSLGDCVICMESIDIESPVDEKVDHEGHVHGSSNSMSLRGMVGAVRRKNYSLAPCHHLFHTACLERWLAIKSICPQCRRPLPPL